MERESSQEQGCSEAGQLYTSYSGAIMRKNNVVERNGGLLIVKLLDPKCTIACWRSYSVG